MRNKKLVNLVNCYPVKRRLFLKNVFLPSPPPVSFPTQGKTVPHHPLGDGHLMTVPHCPLGDHTTTVHAHLQAQKMQHETKALSIGCVQKFVNVRRPTS